MRGFKQKLGAFTAMMMMIIIILLLPALLVNATNDDVATTTTTTGELIFEPTSEWQIIPKGYSVPPVSDDDSSRKKTRGLSPSSFSSMPYS